jgi:hypothetical protein
MYVGCEAGERGIVAWGDESRGTMSAKINAKHLKALCELYGERVEEAEVKTDGMQQAKRRA